MYHSPSLYFQKFLRNNDGQIGYVHLGPSDGALMVSLSAHFPAKEFPFLSIFGIEINTEVIQPPFLENPPGSNVFDFNSDSHLKIIGGSLCGDACESFQNNNPLAYDKMIHL